jgi:hypothetical protein
MGCEVAMPEGRHSKAVRSSADAASAGGRGPQALGDFITSNPLLSLISAGVSIAAVVAGVMTYFANERVDDLLLKHKAELIEATQPLKDKIDDLDFRLSSIERRIPGSNVHYLDVSQVTVGPETIQGLSSRYTSFDDGEFFVNVPQSSNWTYQLTNELDFAMSTYSFMKQALAREPRLKQVSDAPLHLWQEKSVVNIVSSNKIEGQKIDFTFHPALTMQHFDWQMLTARVATLSKIFRSDSVQKDGTKTANTVGKKSMKYVRNMAGLTSRLSQLTTLIDQPLPIQF